MGGIPDHLLRICQNERILLPSIEPKIIPEDVCVMEELDPEEHPEYNDDENEESLQIEKNFLEERRDAAYGRMAEYQQSEHQLRLRLHNKSQTEAAGESVETIEGVWEGGDGRSASKATEGTKGKGVSGVAGEAGGVSPKESSARNSGEGPQKYPPPRGHHGPISSGGAFPGEPVRLSEESAVKKDQRHLSSSSWECWPAGRSPEDRETIRSFVYLLLYVDDMLIASSNMSLVEKLKSQLSNEFDEYHGDTQGSLGCVVSRYMHNPGKEHCNAVKWILRWKAMLQSSAALSTTEAEYIAATKGVKEATWLRGLVMELGVSQSYTVVFSDSQSVIYLTKNDTYHDKTKHIDVRYHFIRDIVAAGDIVVQKVHTLENPADVLTKPGLYLLLSSTSV
nr:Retrovirus-related Pol polyprotein from transposon TNT 1-94 [Ipomoea batatas]